MPEARGHPKRCGSEFCCGRLAVLRQWSLRRFHGAWQAAEVKLDHLDGKSLGYLRFRFQTDASGTADGYNLDDVVISGFGHRGKTPMISYPVTFHGHPPRERACGAHLSTNPGLTAPQVKRPDPGLRGPPPRFVRQSIHRRTCQRQQPACRTFPRRRRVLRSRGIRTVRLSWAGTTITPMRSAFRIERREGRRRGICWKLPSSLPNLRLP